jgi:hypothetical protein
VVEEKEKEKRRRQQYKKGGMRVLAASYIMFRAKSPEGNFVFDRYKPKLAVYHLSEKFDPPAERTKTLCGKLLYINWGVKFLIITKDKTDKIKAAVGKPQFCPKCVKVALVINDIEVEEEEEPKEEKRTTRRTTTTTKKR